MSETSLPSAPPKAPLKLVALALLFPLFMALAYPASDLAAFRDPQPHHMAVEVIRSTEQAPQLAQQLAVQAGDALDVSQVADAQTGRDDVENLRARAAYDPSNGTLYVASAGSVNATSSAKSIFQKVAAQSGQTLNVQDLKPTAPTDSLGAAFMYTALATMISGFVTATILGLVTPRMGWWKKLIVQGVMAVAAAAISTTTLYAVYQIYDSHLLAVAFAVFGGFMAASTFQLGLMTLLGRLSTVVGLTVFVILGLPASGLQIPVDMLPGFFRVLSHVLPTGAVGQIMHLSVYFDRQGIAPYIAVLCCWFLLGAGLLWTGYLRTHPGESPLPPDGTPRDPEEPMFAATTTTPAPPMPPPPTPPPTDDPRGRLHD